MRPKIRVQKKYTTNPQMAEISKALKLTKYATYSEAFSITRNR